MHEKVFKLYKGRITEFLKHASLDVYPESVPLEAEFGHSKEPVTFQDRLSLKYRPIRKGECWGHEWESAWFHLQGSVPKEFEGKELCLRIHTGGESLIFDRKGVPVYGLTGFSVFDSTFQKDRYVIGKNFKAGTRLEYWVEAAANGLFGITLPAPHEIRPLSPDGSFSSRAERLELAVFDREVWSFLLDMQCLSGMLEAFGPEDYRGMRLLHILNEALDAYNYNPANAKKARKILAEKAFSKGAASTALKVSSIGHAHIDVGWLWPVRESIRKAARTFSSQLALMEKYPDYKFGASQAELYKMVKDNYPELYAKIKKRVKEGRWEIQGGMWVEADCNIISGESMIRQFLHAKNFFMDEFGFDVRNVWIPDVFGYSAAMPQIMKQCGCDDFLTQKISWSQINVFPHNTFLWRGVDGTEVITHFPPENSYNASATPEQRIKAQNGFRENGYLDEFMSLIGIGDGGGGPSEEYVERELRMKDIDGCPKSSFGRADDFFSRLEKHRSELPVWDGELYLEFHRGTLTTQSRTKRGNRKCEQALAALEYLSACLPAGKYPAKMLDRSWKTVLLNQFHDIIPGSSIGMVYKRTEAEHTAILAEAAAEMDKAAAGLFQKDAASAVLVNTLSHPWRGVVELPAAWRGHAILDAGGKTLPSQEENGKIYLLSDLPGGSFTTVRRGKKTVAKTIPLKKLVLENELIRYEFSKDGQLTSAYDKIIGFEILSAPGNVLSLYKDRPLTYDAWDIEIYYKRDYSGSPECVSVAGTSGAAFSMLEFVYKTEKSELRQKAVLRPGSRRLDFITHADWREHRVMLRTEFPVNIESDTAAFDIQYAYVKRSTHDNTSWDEAKFEVCGQRYADLSRGDYGAALLNDCKYGYRVKDSSLELTLLRSPRYPDFSADLGEHDFTYSFLPHTGTLTKSEVMREAACLNRVPYVAEGFAAGDAEPPCRIESEGVTLEILKRAEKDDSRIVRLVETQGMPSEAVLRFKDKKTSVSETNPLEWTRGKKLKLTDGALKLSFRPFEIRTFRFS